MNTKRTPKIMWFSFSLIFMRIIFFTSDVKYILECNLCTNFVLFTSFNIDILHLIIVIYLHFIFVGVILFIGAKIELQDDF